VAAVDVKLGAVSAWAEPRPGRMEQIVVGEQLDPAVGRVADDLSAAGPDYFHGAHPTWAKRIRKSAHGVYAARVRRAEDDGEQVPEATPGEGPEEKRPGLMKRLKQHAKDAVVSSTSTHGGVAGGIGGRKSRKRK
jgi:hypothetical protein